MSNDEALRALQRQMAKLTAGLNRVAGDTPVILFKDYALQYMTAKLARPTLRASTKISFENQVRKHLIPRFGMLPLDKITNAIWLQWVEDEKGLTKFFNARKSLVEILTAAAEQGHLEKVPELDNPDEYENVGRALEDREVLAFLWKCRRPFRFIFYVFWRTGCRPREVLRWEHSFLRKEEPGKPTWVDIPARISKTNRSRSIPLAKHVGRIVRQRQVRGNNSIYTFPARQDNRRPQLSYQSAKETARKRAKVADMTAYDFRRTFVTYHAARGVPLLYLAKILDTSVGMLEKIYAKNQAETLEGIVYE
jgi:integrase